MYDVADVVIFFFLKLHDETFWKFTSFHVEILQQIFAKPLSKPYLFFTYWDFFDVPRFYINLLFILMKAR